MTLLSRWFDQQCIRPSGFRSVKVMPLDPVKPTLKEKTVQELKEHRRAQVKNWRAANVAKALHNKRRDAVRSKLKTARKWAARIHGLEAELKELMK